MNPSLIEEERRNTFITVVICTFNRAELLSDCLASLAAQTLNINLYEVIVVDNNSADATLQVAGEFAARIRNFQVITELHQGLSHARNRGWREAKGEFVAYIDDDARACTDWLAQMMAFIERRPEVCVFGGPYSPRADKELPPWFPSGYGALNLGDQERPLADSGEFISGTNMVFRRDLLVSIGGFNPDLGMVGKKVAYGEETQLLRNIAALGVPVYYVPAMKVSHLIASEKLSLKWLLYSSYCRGRDVTVALNQKRSLISCILGIIGEAIKAFPRILIFSKYPLKFNLYKSLKGLYSNVGAIVGYLSLKNINNK